MTRLDLSSRKRSHPSNGAGRSPRRLRRDNDFVKAEFSSPASEVTFYDEPSRTKFIVALDYGTTYSSVSYVSYDPQSPPTALVARDIKSISRWPNSGSYSALPQVPSESWYRNGEYFWGYNARRTRKGTSGRDGLGPENKLIQFAKLLLADRPDDGTSDLRQELRKTLRGAHKDEEQVIKDFIRELLKHTKKILSEDEGFHYRSEVELVLCVPCGWSWKATRVMQQILLEVAEEIEFGIMAPLFILNEPEAAAAFILESRPELARLEKGDVFMVCDAGGGTVDTIMYKVRQKHPFRVDEIFAPAGGNYGSSFINKALRKHVIQRLEGEKYLFTQESSQEYLIEHEVMQTFEHELKGDFDVSDGLDGEIGIRIHGLKRHVRKRFEDNLLYISRGEMAEFFEYSLDGICDLIREQLGEADRKGFTVGHILLVGGFAASPTLRHRIRNTFPTYIKLIYPAGVNMATVVSHGAVFRAVNKSDGPRRRVMYNFGFLQIEEYNVNLPQHRKAARELHSLNGKLYIYDVLDWVIKKNQILRTKQPFKSSNYQIFEVDEELEIKQRVYISDANKVENHYQESHPVNRGAEVEAILVVNLEHLKHQGLITPKEGITGKTFYEIHYELGMEIDGRNMRIRLFHPPGGPCRGEMDICIAAAFKPGTE